MNLLNPKILTALLLVFLVWALSFVFSVRKEKNEISREKQNIENKISDIKKDNVSIENFLDNFNKPDFIDKEARTRFNYKALGEEVVFIHRDLNTEKASSAERFSVKNIASYKNWWNYLLGF